MSMGEERRVDRGEGRVEESGEAREVERGEGRKAEIEISILRYQCLYFINTPLSILRYMISKLEERRWKGEGI